jgi:hypothetical protein
MRRVPLFLALALLGATRAAAQLRDVPTPDTLGANFRHDSVGTSTPTDFDFLDGTWTIRFQSRKSATEFNPAVPGTRSAHRTHDGLVIDGGKTWIRDFWKIEANRAR